MTKIMKNFNDKNLHLEETIKVYNDYTNFEDKVVNTLIVLTSDTLDQRKDLHLEKIIETYANQNELKCQSIIVWTPTMTIEQSNYWRSQIPDGFRLCKIAKYYKEGFALNYPHMDGIWYWEDYKNDGE